MLSIHCFTFNAFQENTYLLYNEHKQCVIIDPGFSNDTEQATFEQYIISNKLKPIYLLNTHCHIDHILGNNFSATTWKLPLYFHAQELPVLQAAPQIAEMYGFSFLPYQGQTKFLKEDELIILGSDTLRVLFTPGHSPASISFYSKEQNILISGDVLFNNSIGRTDLPGGDFTKLETSIRTKLYCLPDDTIVYPGHGPRTSIGYEKRNNPFVQG